MEANTNKLSELALSPSANFSPEELVAIGLKNRIMPGAYVLGCDCVLGDVGSKVVGLQPYTIECSSCGKRTRWVSCKERGGCKPRWSKHLNKSFCEYCGDSCRP